MTPDAPTADTVIAQESLPPTQYLMLEVLAARHRLGETCWTFPSTHTPTARALATLGLVGYKSGNVPQTIIVWLTEAGQDCCLSAQYTPPNQRH